VPALTDVPRRPRHSERGQALIEFVMVLPFLALLLFGTVDLARALSHWSDMNQMASVAARQAAVNNNPGDGTLQEWVLDTADSSFVHDNATVNICQPDGDAIGDPVQATVEDEFEFLPILGIGTTTISGSATMRMESRATNYTADSCD